MRLLKTALSCCLFAVAAAPARAADMTDSDLITLCQQELKSRQPESEVQSNTQLVSSHADRFERQIVVDIQVTEAEGRLGTGKCIVRNARYSTSRAEDVHRSRRRRTTPLSASAINDSEVLAKLNHDEDQTLKLPGPINAAAGVFKELSTDGDLTVNRSEIAGRVSESDWAAANKDHDKTLELDEWLGVVRIRFDDADIKHSGKLDAMQLDTPAGQKLVQMIVK